ncbi:MAG: hypothetical protein ACFE0Q_08635 [Anaerolineae bacterium]
MKHLRMDGVYYYHAEDKDLYFGYQFRESGVLSFACKTLESEAIRRALRHPARGSYLPKGKVRLKIAFSRDTTIYATIKPEDDTLDVVITTDYGDQLSERRIYRFLPLDDNA